MNKSNYLPLPSCIAPSPLGVALTVLSITIHLLSSSFAEDDAYIHLRNAQHLWLHGSPFFNLSEPCLSSSSVLWMLLLAPTTIFINHQEAVVSGINGALTVVAAFMANRLLPLMWPKISRNATLLTCGLLYCALLPSSLALMESSLAILLLLMTIYGLASSGSWWSIPAILLPSVRPELLVALCIAVFVRGYRSHWRFQKREVIAAALVIVPLSAWYLGTFGWSLPQSMLAKSIVYSISPSEFIRFAVLSILGGYLTNTIGVAWISVAALLILLSIRKATTTHIPNRTTTLTVVAILSVPTLILTVFATRGVLLFPWYSPTFTVPLLLVLCPFWDRSGNLGKTTICILTAPLVIAGALSALIWVAPHAATFGPSSSRASTLKRIGEVLQSVTPSVVLLAPEIGGLGRGFSGDIVDGVGLTSPWVLRYHPLKVPSERSAGYLGAVPPDLVNEIKPDVIVGLPLLLEGVRASKLFSHYQELKIPLLAHPRLGAPSPIPVWGNTFVSVLIRTEPEASRFELLRARFQEENLLPQ